MPPYSPDQIKRSQDLIAGSKDLVARAQAAQPTAPAPAPAPPINRTIMEGNQYNPGSSAGVSVQQHATWTPDRRPKMTPRSRELIDC